MQTENLFTDEQTGLRVVKAQFEEVQEMTWKDLFGGYDEMKAITYSSSAKFIAKLLPLFKKSEIIFGCPGVMSYTLQEAMAFQLETMEKLKEIASKDSLDLIQMMEAGRLEMRVSREQISHEKTYLLSSEDGRRRVVLGSANLSGRAFGGKQRENIIHMDGDEAYEYYLEVYEKLREISTDNISTKCYQVPEKDRKLTDLPIQGTAEATKVLVIETMTTPETQEEIKFITDTKTLAANLQPIVPTADKEGYIKIEPKTLKSIQRKLDDATAQKKMGKEELASLTYDPDGMTATLNGKTLDLNPPVQEIEQDANLFLEYMDGFSKFIGDAEAAKRDYFAFAVWFLATPFLARLRIKASMNHKKPDPYPMFGVLVGQAKAGKTAFVEMLTTMMVGQRQKVASENFTRARVNSIRASVKGVPVLIDDVVQAKFLKEGPETIKQDDFEAMNDLQYCPAIAVTGNDLKGWGQDVTRRAVVGLITAGLRNTVQMNDHTTKRMLDKVGTAFYREYMRRMLEAMPDMERVIEDQDRACPDMFEWSSKTLTEMLMEYGKTGYAPNWAKPLTLDDYFDERRTALNAMKIIPATWKADKARFTITPKQNKVYFAAADHNEARRLYNELPEDVRELATGGTLVMNLDKAKEFFGLSFKKPLLGFLTS